ncbi:SbcC/MukB-like Walker B domain-containing protein [Candidatus Blastococcus massiliensis]|uniref:SbcC/MukB-like Walker B domain-containing protein n=1 Tax=Candidatus Blastococcus massiliensis TaxID=1470358 RepID=UPI0004B0063C|nr:SbcC/MukB-like Walker B domain-containing protein [Candidatus Blastococcus massiliensis]
MTGVARWRLHRAGIQNVWHYWDTEFLLTGGRMVLRGTNGSGKSRALELLLPFLLDTDRRRMDSSGSASVSLDRLMRVGGPESGNRVGYLWLELAHGDGAAEPTRYLTLGAHLRWSSSTGTVRVHWFTTDLRVGHDLPLLDAHRNALSREDLGRLVGPEQVTDSPDTHRERVRQQVFGLVDARAEERFDGLTRLLHTLRSPDVGNRIDEGRLPALLSDALPPLSQTTLDAAGAKLDEISETRALQERLERSVAELERFLTAYRRYAQGELAAATGRARSAVRDRHRAERTEATAARTLADAETAAADAASTYTEAQEHLVEVRATLRGLQESAAHRDLLERAQTVAAQWKTAAAAADSADAGRRAEADVAARVVREAREATDVAERTSGGLRTLAEHAAAAGIPSTLPAELGVRVVGLPGTTEPVRTRPDGDPEPLHRPVRAAVDLGEHDLPALRASADAVRQAAADRRAVVGARLDEHQQLSKQEDEVIRAEQRRDEAGERVRASADRRDAAVAAVTGTVTDLALAWRTWVSSPETTRWLGEVTWADTGAAGWLAEPVPESAFQADALDRLDRTAAEAALPATEQLLSERAELQQRRTALLERDVQLTAALAELRDERDPEPDRPAWAASPAGIPLWRAVDFAPGAGSADQAGVEAALIASGLLTAVLAPDGVTAPGTGELLVSAAGQAASRPLSELLIPDPASGVPVEQVTAVLERIGWADRSGECWLDRDGSFRLGALTGRHTVPHARHIGATARARHRAERIEELEAERRSVGEAVTALSAEIEAVATALTDQAEHVRTAPRSGAVREAAAARRSAERELQRETDTAAGLARAATELRLRWDAAQRRHAEACDRLGLPPDEPTLSAARERARQAVTAAETVSSSFGDLARALKRVDDAGVAADRALEARRSAEASADLHRGEWHEAATALAAAELAAGLDADTAHQELKAAERAVGEATETARTADERRLETHARRSAAATAAQNAAAAAGDARTAAATAEEVLRRVAELPGLAEAAGLDDLPVAGPLVDVLLAGLSDPLPEPDPDGYQKALLALEKNRDPGDYDLIASVVDGVNLVHVVEATGRRTLSGAVAELVRRRDGGRAALTEREQRIFTTFVLGSVADELRQQLLWSTRQVELMNERLSGIRTSHGIGVEIRWPLAEDASGAAARIEELVRTRASARSEEANAELSELLRARVEDQLRADPAQGYATALRMALDHRSWHTVEVYILGPTPGERRRISRRARLSQGETRVVSYLALFAAADAFFTGLPDSEALRLILLDDAFAKVDERTIGELMAQLVRLDLDFVMTGHALWGFGPGVPSLDVYEVRRAEGTSAITTRVHWDGTSRHVFT